MSGFPQNLMRREYTLRGVARTARSSQGVVRVVRASTYMRSSTLDAVSEVGSSQTRSQKYKDGEVTEAQEGRQLADLERKCSY